MLFNKWCLKCCSHAMFFLFNCELKIRKQDLFFAATGNFILFIIKRQTNHNTVAALDCSGVLRASKSQMLMLDTPPPFLYKSTNMFILEKTIILVVLSFYCRVQRKTNISLCLSNFRSIIFSAHWYILFSQLYVQTQNGSSTARCLLHTNIC